MRSWIPLLGTLAFLVMPGCVVAVDHDGPGFGDALFTVEWTVDGSTQPAACWDFGAEYAYVTVESRYGVEDYRTLSCERFGYDFYLPPGRYWVTIVLQDRHHDDITAIVETGSRTLYAGESDYVVIDFPGDSFF